MLATTGCWRSHELERLDASRPIDAGTRGHDAFVPVDGSGAIEVRCGASTCTHSHACVWRPEGEPECVPRSRLPPPPPEGLGRFFPDFYEVRFCDDDGDCPVGTNCRFWLGEAFVFSCTAPPADECEGFAPELVCDDDSVCPMCRPTCRQRGRDGVLAACSF